jgi:hypothetical protein
VLSGIWNWLVDAFSGEDSDDWADQTLELVPRKITPKCNPDWFEPSAKYERSDGRVFTGADLNLAARVVFAEASGSVASSRWWIYGRIARGARSRRLCMRIPMMSISHSDLMPISSERSDAGLSQCETVIDIRQDFSSFSFREPIGFANFCFLALMEGARRATGVSAKKHAAALPLLAIFAAPPAPLLAHRLAL